MRDRVQAAADRRDTLMVGFVVVGMLGFFGTALFVIAHFIIKFW